MKKTKKHKSKISKKLYSQQYPARALAVVLMLVIFLDGMMFGAVGAQDLKAGLQLLDVSGSVQTTAGDLAAMAEPLIAEAISVHQFYVMASNELFILLDNNIVPNIGSLFQDVVEFYKIAAKEMTNALDLSEELSPPSVYASGY